MTVIREFIALMRLQADIAEFRRTENRIRQVANNALREVAKLERGTRKFSDQWAEFKEVAGGALNNIAKVAAGAAVVVGGVGVAFRSATKDVVENARLLDKWNKITGESVENLDALRLAVESTGGDVKKTFEGMSELADRASDVVTNIKDINAPNEATEGFRALGFKSLSELQGPDGHLKNIPELFDDVLDRLGQMENEGERAGAAMRLFGDDTGLAIAGMPLDRLKQVRQEMLDLGIAMTGQDVKAIRDFEQSIGGAGAALRTIQFQAIKPLLPLLTKVADGFRAIVQNNRALVSERLTSVFRGFVNVLLFVVTTIRDYAKAVDFVVTRTIGWKNVLRLLSVLIGLVLARQVGKLAFALTGMLLKALLAVQAGTAGVALRFIWVRVQSILLGAQILLLIGLFDELIKTFTGGETIFTRFVDIFDPDKVNPDDHWMVKVISKVVGGMKEIVRLAANITSIFTEDGAAEDEAFRSIKRKWDLRQFLFGMTPAELEEMDSVFGPWQDPNTRRLTAPEPGGAFNIRIPTPARGPATSTTRVIRLGDVHITAHTNASPEEIAGAATTAQDDMLRKAKRKLEE